MPFAVNGTTMNLAPYEQAWRDIIVGIDHVNRPVFSAVKDVQLRILQSVVTVQWNKPDIYPVTQS